MHRTRTFKDPGAAVRTAAKWTEKKDDRMAVMMDWNKDGTWTVHLMSGISGVWRNP